MFREMPLAPWPPWSCLGALCAVRALVADTDWLDELEMGISMRTATAAGKAIVALRRDDDTSGAARLPWVSTELLRVHVPPSMLCELAMAVSDSIPAAAACLDQIPESTRWVERLIDHPHAPLRAKARLHERHPCQAAVPVGDHHLRRVLHSP